MKKVLFVFQIILKCSLIFLMAFVWLRFFLHSLILSSLLAAIVTALIELLSYIAKRRRNDCENLKIKEKEDAENMFLSLASASEPLEFFFNLAHSRHENVAKKKDYIIVTYKDNKKSILYPFLQLTPLMPQDVVTIIKAVKKEKVQKIVIPCFEFSKESQILLKNFDTEIILLDRFESYLFLYKEYDFYPEITITYKKEAKNTFKDLLAYSFNRSRTKSYLFSAAILILTSLFLPTNIYYCIVASILLLFALISYINPRYNKKVVGAIL